MWQPCNSKDSFSIAVLTDVMVYDYSTMEPSQIVKLPLNQLYRQLEKNKKWLHKE